jgi:dipeptidase D
MGGEDNTAVQTAALSGLEPEVFWAHFEALTKIARPSRQEEEVSEHVKTWADEHGFEVEVDSARNLVVRVPATQGREAAPKVTLQGHLDMVCEREPDSPNDPAEGRIELIRDGEWLKASGTTLGADDGVAIAAMMALVEDESLQHGPLELLMTVAEEVGLEGANGLDPKLVTGSILVNLDSEEDGKLTVGCAGSTDTWIHVEQPRSATDERARTLAVTASGGLGGHSGSNIALGRANAIKLVGRVLREAYEAAPFRLVSLNGGKSRNAIPRDAVAVVSVAANREQAFREAAEKAVANVRDAFKTTDGGATVILEDAEEASDAWTEDGTSTLLDVIALVPTGPLAMSQDFDDLVETSTSLGEAVTQGGRLTLHSLSRSSNDSALPETISALAAAARLGDGEFEVKHNYRGWRPNLDSAALAATRDVYERLFGEAPIVTGVHAGLETAVIGDKIPGLDMISFGPQIEAPHSPDERVSVPTVERFWKLLVGTVDELSQSGRTA